MYRETKNKVVCKRITKVGRSLSWVRVSASDAFHFWMTMCSFALSKRPFLVYEKKKGICTCTMIYIFHLFNVKKNFSFIYAFIYIFLFFSIRISYLSVFLFTFCCHFFLTHLTKVRKNKNFHNLELFGREKCYTHITLCLNKFYH